MKPSVFLAVPHYASLVPQALAGLMLASRDGHLASINLEGGSLLGLVFNKLWCRALNERDKGLTHFAMHHADVEAPPGWLDVLLEEQARVGADVLSVVVPIKDGRGLTSCGLRHPETGAIRRFTLKELQGLPPTFSASDTAHPHQWLMVNTGLWLCDFTRPWVEEVCFNIIDAIVREAGRFAPRALPEDWNFSGWCARKGLRVFATRAVKVGHHGTACFRNDSAWGDWDTDKGDFAA
jgi:hypothetical protein